MNFRSLKMPVLFIGHGSPLNMILDNGFTRSLSGLGRALPVPRAILVISAHWLSRGTLVSCVKKPGMIYDFFGFPDALYDFKYECPGAPEFCRLAVELAAGKIKPDAERGLDHGAYSVLKHLFPGANIPVFEMSLDYSFNSWSYRPMEDHYRLAKKLSGLRSKGILIIASGNMVHNLARIDYEVDAKPYKWAVEIDQKLKSCLVKGDHQYLLDLPNTGKDAAWAAPTLDHYIPLIYAIGLQEKSEPLKFTYEGIQNGSISMRAFQIG